MEHSGWEDSDEYENEADPGEDAEPAMVPQRRATERTAARACFPRRPPGDCGAEITQAGLTLGAHPQSHLSCLVLGKRALLHQLSQLWVGQEAMHKSAEAVGAREQQLQRHAIRTQGRSNCHQ